MKQMHNHLFINVYFVCEVRCKICEAYWLFSLQTLSPKGLNDACLLNVMLQANCKMINGK